MTGTWGRRGGERRPGRDVHVCVREKERECLGEGGGMKARFGDRGLKTQGPPNPPSTEILALNPSYGIVCCCGDFCLFFFVAVILFNGLSLAPSAPPSLHLHSGFFSREGFFFVFFLLFWFLTCLREEGESCLTVL